MTRPKNLLLLAILSGLVSSAQTPPAQPAAAQPDAPATFRTKVRLVLVPVVVRNRGGRAISTLQKEDFQLFDKGKRQEITRFSAETRDAPAVEAQASDAPRKDTGAAAIPGTARSPERYIAYLIDDIHLERGDLLQTRQAMHRHIDESLDPASRAAIFITSGRMLAGFTGDRERLHQAVNSVQPWTGGPDPQQDCPPISYYMADLLVNKLLYLDGVLYSDQQLVGLIQGGSADQALTAVIQEAEACSGLGLPPPAPSPGKGSASMMPVPLVALVRTEARQILAYGDHETAAALGAVKDVIRLLSVMPGSRTIVLVSPGFLLTRDHRFDESDVLDRAIRANVTVNTIDMRGLYATIPGGDASQRGPQSSAGGYLTQASISAASQVDDVLAEMADGTGGTFFHNDNGLREGLNRLGAPPECVYVLGFSPRDLKLDGSFHALRVRLKKGTGLELQVRRGYFAHRDAIDPVEQAKQEIQEALLSRAEILDLPVELHTEFVKAEAGIAKLTVFARVDVKSLHLRKAAGQNLDTLTMAGGVFDQDGKYITGVQKVFEVHIKDQELDGFEASGIVISSVLDVMPGSYLVRLVIRDSEGAVLAARNGAVEIP